MVVKENNNFRAVDSDEEWDDKPNSDSDNYEVSDNDIASDEDEFEDYYRGGEHVFTTPAKDHLVTPPRYDLCKYWVNEQFIETKKHLVLVMKKMKRMKRMTM